MDLNFPVFATGVRIFRASNDKGPLFLDPGSTRILEINTRYATKWRGTAKFLFIVDFPDFWKINGWNALTLWTPISCCAPGLLSYSYYFAYYILPSIYSKDRLSTKSEVYFGFSRTPTCLLLASPVFSRGRGVAAHTLSRHGVHIVRL